MTLDFLSVFLLYLQALFGYFNKDILQFDTYQNAIMKHRYICLNLIDLSKKTHFIYSKLNLGPKNCMLEI